MNDTVLHRYLDGELNEAQAAYVEARLQQDSDLRRRAAELQAVEAAYRDTHESMPAARRKALHEQLHTAPGASSYDVFHRADLQDLAKAQSPHMPVISLYLDLDSLRRQSEPPLAHFKALVRNAEQQIHLDRQPKAYRQAWMEEVGQLQDWLEGQQPLQGRGLAVLSCRAIGLWRAFRLPLPVRDRLEVSERPYLRPLAALLDEFEAYLVTLIDSGTARFLAVRLGMAEEISRIENYVPPETGHMVEKTGHRHDTYLHRHAKSVAARCEKMWHEQDFDWLVIGGTEEALGELRDLLPKALRDRLAGETHLSPQVEMDRILEHVLEIEREHERRIEAQRVEELITTAKKGGAAVLGLDETLLAVVEERVQMLIVEEDFRPSGWVCLNCRFMGAREQPACPLCGNVLHAEPDIIELVLERVLDQNADMEVLRSAESRRALEQHGRIGALLRYTYASPLAEGEERLKEKEELSASAQPLDEKIDEALEETFPASDPPYWMPI